VANRDASGAFGEYRSVFAIPHGSAEDDGPLGGSRIIASMTRLDDDALDQLFRKARTHRAWVPEPVDEATLRQLYDLFKWGPTSANSCPARFVFIVSEGAKARLLPALSPGNVLKSRAAPVVVIVAYDSQFYEQLPLLAPGLDASRYADNAALARETAERNGTLQGAYFVIAARAFGLDCGPMSGFHAEAVNREFFPDGRWRVNFICNLGHGDASKLQPRAARLDFSTACEVL
jgi:nitroreductase